MFEIVMVKVEKSWQLAVGSWQLVVSGRRSAVSSQQSAVGGRRLIAGQSNVPKGFLRLRAFAVKKKSIQETPRKPPLVMPIASSHFKGNLFSSLLFIFVKKQSMTIQDIKKKINKAIEEVPESYLPDILAYLNELKKSSPKNIDTLQNFKKILKEDRTILQKLAK